MSGRGCGGVGGVGGLVHGSSGKQPTSGIRGVLSEEGGAEGGVVGGILGSSIRRIHQAGGGVTGSDERRRHASTSAIEQRSGGGHWDAGGHDEGVAPQRGGGAQWGGKGRHPRREQAWDFPCKRTQSLNFWQGTGKEG